MIKTMSQGSHKLFTSRVNLAEHDLLQFVVQGQHTSTSNTTENVCTSTLEEGFDTLLGDDLHDDKHTTSDQH